jgi:integrase
VENYSKPPIRAQKTHEANERAALHLQQAFALRSVADITVDDIEHYLRRRLQARIQFKTGAGLSRKIGSSLRRFTRSYGSFAVCSRFPGDRNPTGHQKTLTTVWHAALRRAKVPYFLVDDLRSTYATRLSAGGIADEWVTRLLRSGDAKVFKK